MSSSPDTQRSADPHAGLPVSSAGPSLEQADAALVLIHGRGGSAASILSLYHELNAPTIAAYAPHAKDCTWYPHSFLAPLDSNQPYLDSALKRLDTLVTELLTCGMPENRLALLGFSQGACLTLEYVARHPRAYGAVMGLTGGLLGPPGTPRDYPGSLTGTRAFLGTSDPDAHVPFARVQETKIVLEQMGAEVELRRYPGEPHSVNQDEINACRLLLAKILA